MIMIDIMIERPGLLQRIRQAFEVTPIVTLLGPRQCGKTTLARMLARESGAKVYDLEDPADDAALRTPSLTLGAATGLVILDEIQRRPDLYPILRVLADRESATTRFLLLGSASDTLVRSVSESLAGRTSFVDMGGLSLGELPAETPASTLWTRGGFPRAWLAPTDQASLAWRTAFVRTFLERDIPQLGIRIPAAQLGRFWTMLAHYHGQILNAAELARSMGSSEKTIQRYISILEGTFIIRTLQPWHENLGKRLVKAPKIYLRDSGILHALLGLRTLDDLMSHPKAGASWEGFAIEEAIARNPGAEPWFFATHGGAEVDLVLVNGARRTGFEMKLNQAPVPTKSMHIAMDDLGLDALYVVYPGTKSYALGDRMRVIPVGDIPSI